MIEVVEGDDPSARLRPSRSLKASTRSPWEPVNGRNCTPTRWPTTPAYRLGARRGMQAPWRLSASAPVQPRPCLRKAARQSRPPQPGRVPTQHRSVTGCAIPRDCPELLNSKRPPPLCLAQIKRIWPAAFRLHHVQTVVDRSETCRKAVRAAIETPAQRAAGLSQPGWPPSAGRMRLSPFQCLGPASPALPRATRSALQGGLRHQLRRYR